MARVWIWALMVVVMWAVVVVLGDGQQHQEPQQEEVEEKQEQQQTKQHPQQLKQQERRPNVVVLIADDLGIGDLGCYGNTTINTPNIDRVASEGIRLTHHLAASALCTPSRAALLTARYPARYGLVGDKSTPPVVVHVASKVGLPVDEVTLANALSAANYTTAAVGKWHLGMRCGLLGRGCRGPQQHGFQSFYGIPFTLIEDIAGSHPFWIFPLEDRFYQMLLSLWVVNALTLCWLRWRRRTIAVCIGVVTLALSTSWFLHTHYRFHTARWWKVSPWMDQHMNGLVMHNDRVVEQPLKLEGLSQLLVDHSVRFIADHAQDQRPFFLYHSFAHVHTPMFSAPEMAGRSKHGRYGDNVEEMDAGVGRIMAALKEHSLDQNTLVYFLSDHGGDLEVVGQDGQRVGGYNGRFKGGKRMGSAEGGIRVPGIYRWSGHIPAGKDSTQHGWGINTLRSCWDFIDYGYEPQLFNLFKDPYEDHPIPVDSIEYIQVTGIMKQFVAEWKARVPYPPSQMSNVANTMHSLWLQPFRSLW
ncbi:Arylsulfatase H-like [Homarus americanus]|uniref:Arylsulfatase H-like n=1 Tax=Homarus americanus TaxID=6706 RepID=A0A8J5T768_HOMAM|nr:Arylsulfatase H-like [Homarus americanus]